MNAIAESREHRHCLERVRRLSQQAAVEHNQRVRGQHDLARMALGHRRGLRPAQAADQHIRRFTGERGLIDVRRIDAELQAERGEQLAPPRGSGGQHKGV